MRPCPHLVGTVVRSRVGRPEVHAHLDGPPHREAVKIVPVAPPTVKCDHVRCGISRLGCEEMLQLLYKSKSSEKV